MLAAYGAVLIIVDGNGFFPFRLINNGINEKQLRFMMDIVIDHSDQSGTSMTFIVGIVVFTGIICFLTFGTIYFLDGNAFVPSVIIYGNFVGFRRNGFGLRVGFPNPIVAAFYRDRVNLRRWCADFGILCNFGSIGWPYF